LCFQGSGWSWIHLRAVRMLDGSPGFKCLTVAGAAKMTAVRAIWVALAVLAAVSGVVLGVPIGLTALALTCAVLPSLVGTFMTGSASPVRTAELETVFWIVLATVSVASTGGTASPLIILFAVAVAIAWTSGEPRLTAETAAFSLVGFLFAAIASSGGGWL